MSFLGLPLVPLLALFAGAAGVLTVLYLLRQRRRRIEVPFARLWQKVARQTESTTLWQRLKRWLSLLLLLVILALLVGSLGDPRLSSSEKGRTVAFLIDATASMQATMGDSDGAARVTRMDRAREEARRLIRGMAGDDLGVVVVLDGQPAPVGGLTGDERDLLLQVDGLTARDGPGDLPRALRLCGDLLAGRKNPQIVLISDGGFADEALSAAPAALSAAPADPSAVAPRLLYLPVGSALPVGPAMPVTPMGNDAPAASGAFVGNVAITAFSVRRYRHNRLSYEVLLELASFPQEGATPRPAQVVLELLQEGEIVDVQKLTLAPGQRTQRLYPNLSGSGLHLEARIHLSAGRDLLPLDDQAYALLPERRRQRVLLVTGGDLFLEGALLSASAGEESQLQIDKVRPAAYDGAQAARYDAVIFDGFTPKVAPETNTLYLGPEGEGSPVPIAEMLASPYITDVAHDHPLLRWVTLKDVNVSRTAVFRLEPGDVAVASMLKQPLVVARERRGEGEGAFKMTRTVVVGFDLRHSDLPLRVAFPVLLVNALDWFSGDVAADARSYATGHTWRIPLSGATDRATLALPDGSTVPVPVHDGHALYHGQRVGFYELRPGETGPRPAAGSSPAAGRVLLSANLSDPTESAVRTRRQLRIGGAIGVNGVGRREGTLLAAPDIGRSALKREIWPYLVLLGLLLLCLEWWTYHRRWTV